MTMKRREFLKSTMAVSAVAGLSATVLSRSEAAPAQDSRRDVYELRVYRFKSGASTAPLEAYLEKAAIPAFNRLGVKSVGVFTDKEKKDPPAVFLLLPYSSMDGLAGVTGHLNADAEYQKAGANYLNLPKSTPGFDRIDSWLLLAFAGMPKLELAAYSRERRPRLFELRTYESHSEVKALKKVEMFNAGEIDVMREVGLAPVFYGQALVGANLPHLTYMTSGENEEVHKQHWDAFGKHPVWDKLKNDPQYADTVSKITKWILAPTAYSQI